MKLIVRNRTQMMSDLGDHSHNAHKASFSFLSSSLLLEKKIPIEIFVMDVALKLYNADIEKDIYIYDYLYNSL